MRLEYYHRESQPGESSTTAAYATAGKKAKNQHGAGGLRPGQGRAHPLARTLFQTIIQRQESGSFADGGAQGRWLGQPLAAAEPPAAEVDRKSTRLNSSHGYISYAVFCLKKKKKTKKDYTDKCTASIAAARKQ